MSYIAPTIDGTTIATPSASGVQITRELIQSSKTRRTSGNGTMKGKVVAKKVTVKFSFPPNLTSSQISVIKSLVVNKTFEHTLGFTNELGEWETITCYFGDYSVDQYGFINGRMINQSLGFTAVEC